MAIAIDNLKFRVLTDTLYVRTEPSSEDESISGMTYKAYELTATQISDDGNWYYIPYYKGWVKSEYLSYTESKSENSTDITKSASIVNNINEGLLNNYTSSTTTGQTQFLTNNLTGIFGIPYQFMESVDRNIEGNQFGRKYAEKIIGRLPVLFLAPGKQEFLSNYSNGDAASILASLVDQAPLADGIESRSGKFYTFKFAVDEYYSYVNPMCQSVAQLLGIGSRTVNIGGNTAQLRAFDWSRAVDGHFKSYFGAGSNVMFYVDGLNSINESFTNDTRESSLAGTINGLSDTAKEIGFLVGYDNAAKVSAATGDAYDATLGQITSLVNDMTSGGGIITNILSGENISTILQGGKLIFPEMWGDSSFSRSYNVSFKFRSPDADSLSVYLNVLVPYIHLLAMILPHSEGANAYSAPFLVRGFYKGLFNVDMGIITDMSVTKGKEGAWNDDGIPTEMDVDITIKDLYSSLTATNNSDIGQLVNNTALMDYLSNLSGINLAQDEITRKLEIHAILTGSKVANLPSKVWSSAMNDITNVLKQLY